MSPRSRLPRVVLGSICVLGAATPGAAQDASPGLSRIRPVPSQCHPEPPCTAPVGLIWDSTNAAPTYTPAMRAVGIGGEVVLTFGVREDGRVDSNSIDIVRASNQAFVPSALAAVRSWRFDAVAAGRPAGLLPVEIHLIYAHGGVCEGTQSVRHTGWAARNQLVVGTCSVRLPRDQVRRRKPL